MNNIDISIYMLNDYAKRITSVSARISRLDDRLNSLRRTGDEYELIRIINNYPLTIFDRKLQYCQMYLQETANDFKKIEDELASHDPMSYKPGSISLINELISGDNPVDSLIDAVNAPLLDVPKSLFVDKYMEILNGNGSEIEKKDAVIKLLNSSRKDIKVFLEYYEWFSGGDEIKLPEPISDGLSFIKTIDKYNKLFTGEYEFLEGYVKQDSEKMTEGGTKIIDSVFSFVSGGKQFKDTFETPGSLKGFYSGLIWDFGKNMVTNFLEIDKYDNVWDAYKHIFVDSAVETGVEAVEDWVYRPAKIIASVGGVDIDALNEELTGKTGVDGAFASMGMLYNEISENTTWDNWCSGMAIIGDSIKKGWDDFWGGIF